MRGSPQPLRALLRLALFTLAVGTAAACDRANAAGRTESGSAKTDTPAAATPTMATPAASSRMPNGDTLSDSALIDRADRGRLMGRDSGTVWVVMISDFQCPYCKQWHDSSMAGVKRDYIQTGKVRFAYLNLPLPQHPHARVEAEASLCAGAQQKFWEFSEALFRDQNTISRRPDVLPYLDSLARANALDMTEFARCRKSKAIGSLIESDIQQANRAGIRSTPSFLVGQFIVEGASPYTDFRRAIDTAIVTARTKRSR